MRCTTLGSRLGVIIAVAGLLTVAHASDDDQRPLYVIKDGKRVPTIVIPPPPGDAPRVEHAVQQRATAQQLPASAAQQPVPERDDASTTDESQRPYLNRAPYSVSGQRRYAPGHYAGYPITFVHRYEFHHWYGPGASPWEREEAHFARRAYDREEARRRFNLDDMNRRRERLLSTQERALRLGVSQMRAGDYVRALITLTMAAELDNGDPSCRIHLAQARLARGHYEEAGKVLRRALQLQPKLVYVPLHLQACYPDATTFDAHVDALAAHLQQNRASVDAYFLLGFLEFQRGNYDESYAAFRRVARVWPEDDLTQAYLKVTKPQTK
ncbi:MAG: tetratricopeptide repeat protein [Planctomycetes bacterium]|nr:tetratricopeptide repeat protein [Planctomycetota bacterium]